MRILPVNKNFLGRLVTKLLFPIVLISPICSQAQSPSSSSVTRVAATTASGLRESPAKVLAGAARSGAVTQMPGETYHGPGPMTVGYLGAKKQIILPTGAWILLAAVDRQSLHQSNPVALVSLVFGQFQGGQLKSLMSYLFNGRTVGQGRSWRDADDCVSEPLPASAARAQGQARNAKACGWTRRLNQAAQIADPGWEAAQTASAQLGAPVPVGPVQFTRAWVQDNSGNYLAIRRVDFSSEGEIAAIQQARAIWLNAYLPIMLEGFDKMIAAEELEPIQPGTVSTRVSLPD
jgi:hypothetical protein